MVIEIEGLCKHYKNVVAVDGLTFSVGEGELFAFLGVNGAGKSTTINIMCGVLERDEGVVRLFGSDVGANAGYREKLGIVFQNSVLDKRLTVLDNLKTRASFYGIYGAEFNKRIDELDELLGVREILSRPLSKLSGGQRRRADIARALIHRPSLLILDEPTTGLDPKTRIGVWETVEKLRRERGMTVLLTTHYMEEAAGADHVVILDRGKKVAEGTPHELKTRYASDYVRIYSHIDEAEEALRGYNARREKDCLVVEMKDTAEVKKTILRHPEIFEDFEVQKGNMDDVFLKVTGRDIKEE